MESDFTPWVQHKYDCCAIASARSSCSCGLDAACAAARPGPGAVDEVDWRGFALNQSQSFDDYKRLSLKVEASLSADLAVARAEVEELRADRNRLLADKNTAIAQRDDLRAQIAKLTGGLQATRDPVLATHDAFRTADLARRGITVPDCACKVCGATFGQEHGKRCDKAGQDYECPTGEHTAPGPTEEGL